MNKNYSASSALLQTGTGGKSAATQAVIGNTFTITPTTVVDVRGAFFRYFSFTNPLTVGMDMSVLGPAWAQYNTEMTIPELPTPNIVPDNNFNGTPTIFETDNSYTLSGSLTKILGRHTLRIGRRGAGGSNGITTRATAPARLSRLIRASPRNFRWPLRP